MVIYLVNTFQLYAFFSKTLLFCNSLKKSLRKIFIRR
nr:MAG TPA: hypothetical protein [Bacteriophage sp.]